MLLVMLATRGAQGDSTRVAWTRSYVVTVNATAHFSRYDPACQLAFVGAINYFLEHDIYYDDLPFNSAEFETQQHFNDMAFYTQMNVDETSLSTEDNGDQVSPLTQLSCTSVSFFI
jgi:hypothetical protein